MKYFLIICMVLFQTIFVCFGQEDDKVVDVDNSIIFYEQLRHHKVPAEMHIYPKGDHAFVLSLPTEEWMMPLFKWMKNSKWITD